MALVPSSTPGLDVDAQVRLIAFYRFATATSPSPQTPPKNEIVVWHRVRDASPNFAGHYQPHLPLDLGCYDSADIGSRNAQVNLARMYGVSAFCYFCGWDGENRRLTPDADTLLLPDTAEFPFCICWENGRLDPISEQSWENRKRPRMYSSDECIALIQSLIPLMADPQYVRIDGRPLLIIAEPHALADGAQVLHALRQECLRVNLNNPYLVCYGTTWGEDPIGFDAAVEFPPAGFYPESCLRSVKVTNPRFRGEVRSYRSSLAQWLAAERPGHKLFQTVMPSWDGTARDQDNAVIFVGSTPELFSHWAYRAMQRTCLRFSGEERIIFVRSWNEWNVGCHLEPDRRYDRQYLEALRSAIKGAVLNVPQRPTLETISAHAKASVSRVVSSRSQSAGQGPRVSVVMPAYNHERFVVRALDSIVAQSYDNVEIVVVDDGSRDATGALLDDYAVRCGRRLTVVHQQNAGAHDALNHGLALAKGDYIALINSDDLYAPLRLEKMLAAMTTQRAAFAFSNTRFLDEEGIEFGDDDAYVSELRAAIAAGMDAPDPLYGFIVTNIAISTGNFVFHRDLLQAIGGFCAMQICHDWDFIMAASYQTPLLFLREPLYFYRLHRTNTFVHRKLQGRLEIEQLRTRFFADIERHPLVSDPIQAEKFFTHARSRGLRGFLPPRWQADRTH